MSLNIFRIAWIAVRELLYERVFYILLCFVALSLSLSLLLGQMTYIEQYKLTVDFMLAGGEISMVLFSIFAGISLFQKELTMGSVSMTLAKPISRSTFLLGKFVGQCAVQMTMVLGMLIVTIAVSSVYRHPDIASLAQTYCLIGFESMVLTSLCYFFAVNSGAITTAVISLCFFGAGHLRDNITQNADMKSASFQIWRVVKNLVPDLELFNSKPLASYGVTISSVEMGWAFVYCVICVTFFLTLASLTFNMKDIPT